MVERPKGGTWDFGVHIFLREGLDVWCYLSFSGWMAKAAAKKLANNAAVGMTEGFGREALRYELHVLSTSGQIEGKQLWTPT